MKDLLKGKIEGMNSQMQSFSRKLDAFKDKDRTIVEFNKLIMNEMAELGFDSCITDSFDNTVGVIKGYKEGNDIAVIFHTDYVAEDSTQSVCSYKAGVITALYSAAALKRALLPINGDIYVCGVPRIGCCEFGIRHLFEEYFKSKISKFKGVILCEPTDMNINIGHKGRMEYEITVKVKLSDGFLASKGINMLGTMFPLIHELENVSNNLPSNYSLGKSSLKIKDVHFCGTRPQDNENEFRIVVDRSYIPEEQQENILERATMIAKSVYGKEPSVMVKTAVGSENIKTGAGLKITGKKEIQPWTITPNHPFVFNSCQALNDNGIKANLGYWQNLTTEGSYTFAELGIPTFGFGPESEINMLISKSTSPELLKKAIYGQAMMIHRNIGVPTLGWSSDEI